MINIGEITDNTIVITEEDGSEQVWKIYFYYHNDDRNKDYYLIYQDEDPDTLIVMASEDGKSLSTCSEEEMEEADEMLEAYENDPKIKGIK
ncbi:MAG: hypothetical protein K5694_00665 [Bacilli bacterium]|nr:hypothetical protein [Bacilli bacterium]